MGHDYSEYSDSGATEETYERLERLITEQQTAELEVAKSEDALRLARERFKEVSEKMIPDLLDTMGMEKLILKDGRTVKIQDTIRASIPAKNKSAAMQWLDENNHGGLIKRNVSVPFDREQEEEAAALIERLQDEFPNMSQSRKVESSTLRHFIRLELEAGRAFPMELFGAHIQRAAKITVPKPS